jgi:hypothetical protein
MTASLTQDLNIVLKGQDYFEKFLLSNTAAQQVYKGMAMVISQGSDSTHVIIADGYSMQTNDVFVGIAAGQASIANGAAMTQYVQVYTWPSIVGFVNSGSLTDASIGKTYYVSGYSSTGQTLTVSTGAYPIIGTLFRVENGYAFFIISMPWIHG